MNECESEFRLARIEKTDRKLRKRMKEMELKFDKFSEDYDEKLSGFLEANKYFPNNIMGEISREKVAHLFYLMVEFDKSYHEVIKMRDSMKLEARILADDVGNHYTDLKQTLLEAAQTRERHQTMVIIGAIGIAVTIAVAFLTIVIPAAINSNSNTLQESHAVLVEDKLLS